VLPEELLKKVRLIEISTRRKVDDLMSGSFKSSFKGSGVQFSEHRLYIPGDDVRHIDWKISARIRDPLIKKFEEERELSILLVVDASASEAFGTDRKLKAEAVAELSAMIAHAAGRTGDKVGVLIFSGGIDKIIPPKKGRGHVLRIIRDLLSAQPKGQGTALAQALESAGRILKHSGVIFILSDFHAGGYDLALRRLARKHDVVALNVRDLRESEMPQAGQFLFQDPETGEERWVDTSSYAFRKWLQQFLKMDEKARQDAFRGGKVEELRLQTRDDYVEALVRFFRARARRRK
jgi:uncharacterized protein (DUF58 family)